MAIPLKQAVDMVVRGIAPSEDNQGVILDDHHFYIRPITSNKNLLEPGETSYFRHRHVGNDDRVFYSVNVKGKDSYDAKITRIQYRGPFNSGMKKVNIHVGGALKDTGLSGAIAAKVLSLLAGLNIQSKLDGDWEVQAAKIVDAIGQRMASDAS